MAGSMSDHGGRSLIQFSRLVILQHFDVDTSKYGRRYTYQRPLGILWHCYTRTGIITRGLHCEYTLTGIKILLEDMDYTR